MNSLDEGFVDEAIRLAKKAKQFDEVPVGAVIVKDGKVIAKAFNKKEHKKRVTAHAEILAIEKASKKLKDFRLNGCTIFVTLEPCLMCFGAIVSARIERLVYCASKNQENVISSKELAQRCGLNHNIKIEKFEKNGEAEKILSDYFAEKRNKNLQENKKID